MVKALVGLLILGMVGFTGYYVTYGCPFHCCDCDSTGTETAVKPSCCTQSTTPCCSETGEACTGECPTSAEAKKSCCPDGKCCKEGAPCCEGKKDEAKQEETKKEETKADETKKD